MPSPQMPADNIDYLDNNVGSKSGHETVQNYAIRTPKGSRLPFTNGNSRRCDNAIGMLASSNRI